MSTGAGKAKQSQASKKKRITLIERTSLFNEECRAQRNRLNPRSENLSPLVSDIVQKLEVNFDGLKEKMKASPSPGTQWKHDAFNTTISEIPKLAETGWESGKYTGYGEYIYTSKDSLFGSSKPAANPTYMKPDGTWRSFSEINVRLKEINSPLPRSTILKANSGRYVDP